MPIDTHLDGVQVLFDAPPEGIDTVPMLIPVRQPAPFFLSLRLYFVRVADDDYDEDVPAARRALYRPAWGW